MLPATSLADDNLIKALIYSDDFEFYEEGEKPNLDTYDSAGEIFVDKIGTSKVLHIKNINGVSVTTAEKKISRIENKKVITTVKFMQTQVGSSKNIVLSIFDVDSSLSIFADKGKFYLDTTELCPYVANKWYTFILVVDLLNSSVDLYLDGEKIAEGIPSLLGGIDKISFSATQSPGFYIDDIKIETEQFPSKIYIDGVNKVAIPKSGKTTYTFSAYLTDSNNIDIPLSEVNWNCSHHSGVTVILDKNNLTLEVGSDSEPGTIEIKASTLDGSFFATIIVNVEQVAADEFRIVGESRIAGSSGEARTYSYGIQLKDQNGEAIEDFGEFTWSLSGVDGYDFSEYMSLDEKTGSITVSADTPYREFIMLKATSLDDPSVWQEKKILVTDKDSYLLDNYRYNAVKTHIDNVLLYAKDPYDDSPLIANLINVDAMQPGAYVMGNGVPLIGHNIGAMSSLMRSMINLSNFENDESYRKKVYDIYAYNMEITKDHPTYMYEGGHMEVDLKTKGLNSYQMTRAGMINEIKGGSILRAPAFDIDYERAVLWCKATFIGHAKFDNEANWKNLIPSRHWETDGHSLTEQDIDRFWNDTESYNWERKGAATGTEGAAFPVTYMELLLLLSEYYDAAKTEEEKEEIRGWADKLYSSLDQTGYNPLTGEYTGMWNIQNSSYYEDDWSNIYDLWEEKGGRHWYDVDKSLGTTYNDRWFQNVILGDRDIRPVSEGGEGFGGSSDGKSWVNMYYDEDPNKGVNESNWMFFLEPYMMSRDTAMINNSAEMCDFLARLDVGDKLRSKVVEKMTNGIYNYLNLRYDYKNSNFRAKMSWGLDITGWRLPHGGYYGKEGAYVQAKMPDSNIFSSIPVIIDFALKEYEATDEAEFAVYTNPENNKKEQLKEQIDSIWEIFRDLSKKNFELGDIGNPFTGEKPDLNFATTSTAEKFLKGFVWLYQTFGDEDYLKMAQIIANNIVSSKYDEGVGLFSNSGAFVASTATTYTYAFLLLESVLLDDYENLMEEKTYTRQDVFDDFYYLTENGKVDNGVTTAYFSAISEPSVKQFAILIEEPFSMQVGESRKISYNVLPYDASSTVLWEVSDPEIADISTSGIIKAKRTGTVKVRCVSSSVKGLSSETITVTIE